MENIVFFKFKLLLDVIDLTPLNIWDAIHINTKNIMATIYVYPKYIWAAMYTKKVYWNATYSQPFYRGTASFEIDLEPEMWAAARFGAVIAVDSFATLSEPYWIISSSGDDFFLLIALGFIFEFFLTTRVFPFSIPALVPKLLDSIFKDNIRRLF